ncbi:MAG: IclR family transcriptional regulator [Pseudomonadota bacterium]
MDVGDKISGGLPAEGITPVAGAQAIHRAIALLKQVATQHAGGVRLQVLCNEVGLGMPTAHRIMRSLLSEGLVVKDSEGLYRLGPLTYELGLAAATRLDIRQVCAPSLERLAANSGDTVFLSVRSGLDAVCIDRKEGQYPIRALPLDIGTRRPLGAGANALALLMPLPADEAQEIIAANALRFAQFGLKCDNISQVLQRARELGYLLSDGLVVKGYRGLAVPCVGPDGHPLASLTIAAISTRLTRARLPEIVSLLQREAQRVLLVLRQAQL